MHIAGRVVWEMEMVESKELTRRACTELYTDESPGLKVDPVIVLVLSLGFIFSVVALHSSFSALVLRPARSINQTNARIL